MPPYALIATVPPVPPARPRPRSYAGESGALAATLLTAAVVAACLLWLFAPWKRTKLPRARASIRPEPDAPDEDDAS